MCFLWFHKWTVLGNRRKCERCGAFQEFVGGYDDSYWTDVDSLNICYQCRGDKQIYDDQGRVITCPSCNGTGKES